MTQTKPRRGLRGGTAVAVTCNFAAAGIGTDTGGSIRNPSSFSNLYGIRPSKGLTSIHGVLPRIACKDTIGPMTRTAEDMALLLEVISGSDPADDYTLEADADALKGDGYLAGLFRDSMKGMRIGYLSYSFSYYSYDDENPVYSVPKDNVSEMETEALANLRKAGAEFVDLSEYLTPELLNELADIEAPATFEYDLNKYLNEKGDAAEYKTLKALKESGNYKTTYMNLNWILDIPDELADSFEETQNPYTEKVNGYQRTPEWQKMLDGRAEISRIMKEHNIDAIMYMNNFDVASKELSVVDTNYYNYAGYDMIFGPKFGMPEIVIPMGFSLKDDEHGSELPLGLSVFADFGNEETLMKIAYAYEQQAGKIIRRMPEQVPALADQNLSEFVNTLLEQAYALAASAKNNEGKVQRLR